MIKPQIPPLPPVIAHRGESALAPENTLAALETAAVNGAKWAEIDVNISSDRVPYVHHDDTLKRCSNGAGYLIQHSSTELDELDAGSWHSSPFRGEPLPRLSAVVELLAKHQMGLNLEIKPTAGWDIPTADAICDFLLAEWPTELPLLISSFSETALLQTRKRMPNITTGWLVCAIPTNWQTKLEQLQCQTFHCGAEFVTHENAQAISQAGYPVLCFTVNDDNRARQLLAYGVSSVISDCPSSLSCALASCEPAG